MSSGLSVGASDARSGSRITVYGTTWCPDCQRVLRFLDQNGIDYASIDIDESPQAEEYVREVNAGFRSVPTIVFPDGFILTEPPLSRLATALDEHS
jgi:mycoredoxin